MLDMDRSPEKNGKSIFQKLFDVRLLYHRQIFQLYRINSFITLFFICAYSFIVPIIAIQKGLVEPYAALYDVSMGIIFIVLIIIGIINSRTWFGAFMQIADAAVVIVAFSDVMFGKNMEKYMPVFPTLIVFAYIVSIWLLITAFLGLIDLMQSIMQHFIKLISGKISIMQSLDKKIFFVSLGLMLILIPASIPLTLLYQPTISVSIPEDYQVQYNFWPGKDQFNDTIMSELIEHKVNLEIHGPVINNTFTEYSRTNLTALQQMESELPGVTYRFIIGGAVTQQKIDEISQIIRNEGEILIEATENGTINNWKGFTCDVEGRGFELNREEFQNATKTLENMFDWLDSRASWVQVVSVNEINYGMDQNFDGDNDLHVARGLNGFIPERWSLYAPMLYRCWYDGPQPYGYPQNPDIQFPTAYYTYAELKRFSNSIPKDKMGVYLGITNCTCYGRDMIVDDNGATNGFEALLLDCKLCKSFGIKEITFFLLGSCMEAGYNMGGVFESYGMDFLDTVNATLNATGVDDTIEIKYDSYSTSNPSAVTTWYIQADFIYSFNRWQYIMLFSVGLILSVILSLYLEKEEKLFPYIPEKTKNK